MYYLFEVCIFLPSQHFVHSLQSAVCTDHKQNYEHNLQVSKISYLKLFNKQCFLFSNVLDFSISETKAYNLKQGTMIIDRE